MLELKTKAFMTSRAPNTADSAKTQTAGVCHFLQKYLSKENNSVDGFDFKKTLQFSKIFSRMVKEYGQVNVLFYIVKQKKRLKLLYFFPRIKYPSFALLQFRYIRDCMLP